MLPVLTPGIASSTSAGSMTSSIFFIFGGNIITYIGGDNTYGQLGLDPMDFGSKVYYPIEPPGGWPGNSAVAAGKDHTVLVNSNQNQLYTAGSNTFGQLGNGAASSDN